MNFEEIQSYNQLKKHSIFLSDTTIYDLFKQDKDRFSKFSRSFGDILFDFSKNLIDEKAFEFLIKSAEQLNLKEKIEDMFDGVKINSTERRAVLHTALRTQKQSIKVDGKNIIDDIKTTNKAMFTFAENVRNGVFKGINGTRILDVVNIGIGGSYLGPLMAVEALKPYKTPLINFHFVSNVDGTDIKETLKKQNATKLASELNSDIYTIEDILKELANPGLDPREELEAPLLKSDVLHIEDLKVGMELQGTVRNVASFGAFIDIGLHDDGLVHISKMSKSFVKNPNDIVHVGDIVTCYVADIDLTKQKVQLSLIKNS